jgi:hypothetical protein
MASGFSSVAHSYPRCDTTEPTRYKAAATGESTAIARVLHDSSEELGYSGRDTDETAGRELHTAEKPHDIELAEPDRRGANGHSADPYAKQW